MSYAKDSHIIKEPMFLRVRENTKLLNVLVTLLTTPCESNYFYSTRKKLITGKLRALAKTTQLISDKGRIGI